MLCSGRPTAAAAPPLLLLVVLAVAFSACSSSSRSAGVALAFATSSAAPSKSPGSSASNRRRHRWPSTGGWVGPPGPGAHAAKPPSVALSASSSSSDDDEEHLKTADVLSLPSIRSTLIRQEETIIFALIERAQFRRNGAVYIHESGLMDNMDHLDAVPLGSRVPEEDEDAEDGTKTLSFLEYMLIGTEVLHAGVRRYTSPEEQAFFPKRLSPTMLLQPLDYPALLSAVGGAGDVNFNPILLTKYIDTIVPSVAKGRENGDDEQYGSTVLADIAVLQALSRRVHYGKFVAESKYLSDPAEYQRLVDAGDADGVMELLTNSKVEEQVLRRARLKAATYGREPLLSSLPTTGDGDDGEGTDERTAIIAAAAASAVVAAVEALAQKDDGGGDRGSKVDPSVIESVYRDIIIPLTKDVEVAYLFRRCGREPPPEYAPDRMSIDCK